MDNLKTALDSLNMSLQKLEEAVMLVKNKRIEDQEKISSLHEAITHAYTKMDKALTHLKQGED